MKNDSDLNPHGAEKVLRRGPTPDRAKGTLIALHGRGASAESILSFCGELGIGELSLVAPQALNGTWYPNSFLAPIGRNQPFLSSALQKIESLVLELLEQGVASEKIALLGFSQGACLACEFAAVHPRRFGAVIALTGGLIGETIQPERYSGSLSTVPVFLGAGDPDPHVPFARVKASEEIFERLGATVEVRRYPNMPHTINEDEIEVSTELLTRMIEI